jgi:hypothetical protein
MICQHCDAMREIEVKGMCRACYMRQRRHAANPQQGRRPNGQTLVNLLGYPDQTWRERIYDRIDASGGPLACHEWQGSVNNSGYGIITIVGHNILAHRAMHAFSTGDATSEVVMHTCDNPRCCNPRHLRSGTHQENSDDKLAKGRWNKGKIGEHLKDRPKHPRARRIMTPQGEFASCSLAAEALGMKYHAVKQRATSQRDGFFWITG